MHGARVWIPYAHQLQGLAAALTMLLPARKIGRLTPLSSTPAASPQSGASIVKGGERAVPRLPRFFPSTPATPFEVEEACGRAEV
mmetsp:Transcript_17259/g.48478  ORF Transcript_17259/g.48478 Transcript_17259/m.48478 type:complete len:85 (-) Transcript_17259:1318-1572(-)|eukprot:scaffold284811_cov37-Tisochrysis_lutea.AAC.2